MEAGALFSMNTGGPLVIGISRSRRCRDEWLIERCEVDLNDREGEWAQERRAV